MCNNELTGVTSWGDGCARHDSPGVFTDVTKFHSFIQDACSRSIVEQIPPAPQVQQDIPESAKFSRIGEIDVHEKNRCKKFEFKYILCIYFIITILNFY